MTTLLIALGVALAIGGLVVLPVLAYATLEALPPRSSRRVALGLIAVVINLGVATGGIGLLCLGLSL